MRVLGWLALGMMLGCGASQLEVMGKEEQPQRAPSSPQRLHAPAAGSLDLPGDAQIAQPAVGTPQERALAHVRGGARGVCAGVVVAPRVVVTAHECVEKKTARGLYVEVATSTLTWTEREVTAVVLPACGWQKLDLAALVLDEPVDAFVEPLHVVSSPPPGAHVQALGFGHCADEAGGISRRYGQVMLRDRDALLVDLPLCRGDTGGPLVDTATSELLGLASRLDGADPTERGTTTFTRMDTTPARALIAKAEALGRGAADRDGAIACE